MKTYSKYENSQEFCWYDSSNTLFSKCYDNPGDKKVLKIVFKGGRTYIYKDVDVTDYVAFRDSASNGSAFIKHIRPYTATRIQDTDLEKLSNMKDRLINEGKETENAKMSELNYIIEFCEKDGGFALKLGEKIIYSGIEGHISIVNLFKSMGINCSFKNVDKIESNSDENKNTVDTE